ncbi:MAG TPA: hypothetical protein DEA47_05690 [Peptococcaceae bacterium]|nr:MAG: Uncharacterized protein XD50_0768 [Clostridia bacterium 41_269]HBT20833.1 hypothetical protein [Peptococcaceae bacterium]
MKNLGKFFLRGILILLPVAVTLYIVFGVLRILDRVGNFFIPFFDLPGLGLLISVLIILLIGYVGSFYISEKLIDKIEKLFYKAPIVGKLYSAIKDTLNSLIGEKRSFSKVVMIELEGFKSLAFLTKEECFLENHLVVYVPLAFQVAGLTLIVPKDRVKEVDMDPETALRFMISAGIA